MVLHRCHPAVGEAGLELAIFIVIHFQLAGTLTVIYGGAFVCVGFDIEIRTLRGNVVPHQLLIGSRFPLGRTVVRHVIAQIDDVAAAVKGIDLRYAEPTRIIPSQARLEGVLTGLKLIPGIVSSEERLMSGRRRISRSP